MTAEDANNPTTDNNNTETDEPMEVSEDSSNPVQQYVPGPNAIDITPSKDGGVLKEIIKEGVGEDLPCEGEKAIVHYVGRLLDGTVFDSSRDRNEKFDFILGKGSVIKAWDLGVATMKKGEIAILTCKPEYAYGATGSPPKIPPDATLVFEVELFDWKLEDVSPNKDGSICKRLIEKGQGYTTPNEGSNVTMHIVGHYEGREFEDREVTFTLGEGSEWDVVEGVEIALQKFKKGEKSKIKVKSKYAFGQSGNTNFNIPPDAEVEYEIHLKTFENAKERWELDSDEKIEQAEITKTKGTQYFKAGKYKLALKQYKRVVSLLEYETGLEEEKEQKRKTLIVAGHLNLALCYLKLEEHSDVVKACNKALEFEPKNEKAFFRRGQARLSMNDFELAKDDFSTVVKMDPNNKAARNQIMLCNQKIKQQLEKERKTYRNMFEKFSKQDKGKATPIVTEPTPKMEAEDDPSTWPGPDIEDWGKNKSDQIKIDKEIEVSEIPVITNST